MLSPGVWDRRHGTVTPRLWRALVTYVAHIQVGEAVLKAVHSTVAVSLGAIHTVHAVSMDVMHRRTTEAATAAHERRGGVVNRRRSRIGRNVGEATIITTENRIKVKSGPNTMRREHMERTHSCNALTGRTGMEACPHDRRTKACGRCLGGGDPCPLASDRARSHPPAGGLAWATSGK